MRIRMATGEDAEQVTSVYAPYVESTAISFESAVPSVEEMAARITDRQPAYPWLVAEDGSEGVVGYAYAGRFAARAAYVWSSRPASTWPRRHDGGASAADCTPRCFRYLRLRGTGGL